MANGYAGEVKTKITVDAGDLLKDIKNNIQLAQQTANKFEIKIDASIDRETLSQDFDIAKKRLIELEKIKKEFDNEINKKSFLNQQKVLLDNSNNDFYEGKIDPEDFMHTVQNAAAAGLNIKNYDKEIFDIYNEYEDSAFYIPLEQITSFDSLITYTTMHVESLDKILNSKSNSENGMFEGASEELNSIKQSIADVKEMLSGMKTQIENISDNEGFTKLIEQSDKLKESIDSITESIRIMMTQYELPNEFHSIKYGSNGGHDLSSIQYHGGNLGYLNHED